MLACFSLPRLTGSGKIEKGTNNMSVYDTYRRVCAAIGEVPLSETEFYKIKIDPQQSAEMLLVRAARSIGVGACRAVINEVVKG